MLAGVYAGIVCLLLSFHWYMSTKLPGAWTAQVIYMHQYGTRKNWPWFDILNPMLVLAVVTGCLLYRQHYFHVIAMIILELGLLVGLLAFYALAVSPSVCYWWPADRQAAIPFLYDEFFKHLPFYLGAVLVVRQGYWNRDARKATELGPLL